MSAKIPEGGGGFHFLAHGLILEFSFNKDLRTLSSWFESNHLIVNRTKTQTLSVGPCDYHCSLFLNNSRMEFLQSIKILGLTLDKDLS